MFEINAQVSAREWPHAIAFWREFYEFAPMEIESYIRMCDYGILNPWASTPQDTRTHFDYIVQAATAEQEGLFPLGEVSLIGGASGSGKTTWLLQFLEMLRNNQPLFGREIRPSDVLFIMRDRSEGGFVRTCARLRINPDAFPIYRVPSGDKRGPALMLAELKQNQYSNVELFIIEGLDMWVPSGAVKDFDTVSELMDSIQRVAELYRVAVIGTVGQPKMKSKERYQLQRDCLMGSVAWGRKAETVLFIQLVDPDDPNSHRELWILPRNGKNERHRFDIKDGAMVEVGRV